jgi:DNA-binding transcriptional ArsR family regulator
MDNLVHTWDLATATGQDRHLDDELVEACVAMFRRTCPSAAGPVASSVGRSRCRPAHRPRTGLLGAMGRHTVTGASDEALRALAHPARRAMLRLVWDAERPASELAEAAGLSRPAASQHLKQLRDAGLVSVRVDANRRLYRRTWSGWPGWRRSSTSSGPARCSGCGLRSEKETP